MDILEILTKEIQRILPKTDVVIEIPPDSSFGDYAVPCFTFAKILKKNPKQIAQDLAKKVQLKKPLKSLEVKGPYLNFFLDIPYLAKTTFKDVANENFGTSKKQNKKIIIEYPGPNTNKPLHLGHVRNMCLGLAQENLLRATGNTVIPVNIVNDRGIHICKSMLAYQKFGKGDNPKKSKLKPDFFVGKYYVKYQQELKNHPELEEESQRMLERWEAGDKETLELWKKMNDWAYEGFKETYKTFNIKHKKEYPESKTYKKGRKIVEEGLKKGIFYKRDDGAVAVDLSKDGLDEKVLLRPNGTTVYITQDIYLAKAKYEDYKYDQSIYVVATEQNYHFKVLFEVLKKLEYPFADNCFHFAYGMVNLTTGKMKSREGTVVDADTLVQEIKDMAKYETKKRDNSLKEKELNSRAEIIAMGALRFFLLKFDPVKDITYDPVEAISFEGETGPYVQYAHARICSILRKCQTIGKADTKYLTSNYEAKIVKLISKYPDVVKDAADFKTSHLCRFLLDLSQSFNEFYHNCPVLEADEEIKNARLLLITCTKQVLSNGLNLLGIVAPRKM